MSLCIKCITPYTYHMEWYCDYMYVTYVADCFSCFSFSSHFSFLMIFSHVTTEQQFSNVNSDLRNYLLFLFDVTGGKIKVFVKTPWNVCNLLFHWFLFSSRHTTRRKSSNSCTSYRRYSILYANVHTIYGEFLSVSLSSLLSISVWMFGILS